MIHEGLVCLNPAIYLEWLIPYSHLSADQEALDLSWNVQHQSKFSVTHQKGPTTRGKEQI
jgi:hypothetical protein